MSQLKIIPAAEFSQRNFDRSIDRETLNSAGQIVDDVRANGESALRKYAATFGERSDGDPLWIGSGLLQEALERIDAGHRKLLQRIANRIEDFATAQLECLTPLTTQIPGGHAGHTIEPIEQVGCYAPAGRFPLPSTVLMTAVTARVAGCRRIVVATPNPNDIMLAAAAIAGASEVLAVGGAHAIAALAYGVNDKPPCDLIVGPGSRWVTAAKRIVSGDVGIDMLAGPSELVIVADESADPERIAADLLAQAEHDVDARVYLLTTNESFVTQVNTELSRQLESLPTASTAREAIAGGAAIIADTILGDSKSKNGQVSAVDLANQLAPEHLELHCSSPDAVAAKIKHAGCIFLGHQSAEVFGDYGVGPNHTLPTAGTARWNAGLNVFTFLRMRTWIHLNQAPESLIQDTAQLAEIEGLIAHQRAGLHRSLKS